MENPFKKLWQPHIEVQVEVKRRVKNDIALYKLFGDVTSLFTHNFTDVTKSIFINNTNNQLNNYKNGETK